MFYFKLNHRTLLFRILCLKINTITITIDLSITFLYNLRQTGQGKVVMQGKLIAIAYTLRTYGNQFSLGGICKQQQIHQCSNSIRGGLKH